MTSSICPYCRTPIEPDSDPPQLQCPGCNTPHHVECFEENGGCTIFGCSAAPAEEPKLTIATPDLNAPLSPVGNLSALAEHAAAPPPPFPENRSAPSVASDESLSVRFSPRNTLFVSEAPTLRPASHSNFQTYLSDNAPNPNGKNRTTFILLGVLLGFFGAHSFYAGFRGRGFLQLAITLGTAGIAAIAVWIWAIIDICTITRDNMGVNFRN